MDRTADTAAQSGRIAAKPRARVEPKGAAPAAPMSRGELRAANRDYLDALVAELGKETATQVFEQFLDWAEGSAAAQEAPEGGDVKLAEVTLQG